MDPGHLNSGHHMFIASAFTQWDISSVLNICALNITLFYDFEFCLHFCITFILQIFSAHALFPWCLYFEYLHFCFAFFHMGKIHLGGFMLGNFVIIFVSSGGFSSLFLVEHQCAYCSSFISSIVVPEYNRLFLDNCYWLKTSNVEDTTPSSGLGGWLMVWNVHVVHEALPLPSFGLFIVEVCPSVLPTGTISSQYSSLVWVTVIFSSTFVYISLKYVSYCPDIKKAKGSELWLSLCSS